METAKSIISKVTRIIVLEKNYAKTQMFICPSYIDHQMQGPFHDDKSIVAWTENFIITQCVLCCLFVKHII